MAKISRNLLDGKKRQASLLGSTLTSLTLNSEENDTTSSDEEDESATESDSSQEEELNEDSCHKSGDETDTKSKKCSTDTTSNSNKKQTGKEKPKVRMKTLTIDGQLVYFCIICDKIFTKKKDKINHELAHSNETLISCPECGKDFFHESSLAHHIRSHDGEQLHFCDFCPKMFAQSHQLKAHTLSHSNPTEISCKKCRVGFKTSSDLNSHHRKKIKEEMSALWCDLCKLYCCRAHCFESNFSNLHAFRCFACNELFYTLRKLKLHAKRYAHKFNQSSKSWKPSISDNEANDDQECRSFKANALTIGHKRQIENNDQDEGPESKKDCSGDHVQHEDSTLKEQSETDEMSKMKMNIESPRKVFKFQRKPYCKKCNRSFKETSDLISHKLSVHSSTHGSICRVCGDEFSSDTDLKMHECRMRLVKSQGSDMKNVKESEESNNKQSKVFECHVCKKSFPFHDQLQSHLRLHNNIKSFQCYLCQRNFVTKHYLQRHLQVHIKDGSITKTDHKGNENGTSSPENDNEDCLQSDDDFEDPKIDNALTSMTSLKFGVGKENIYSFSDDSASSFVTRESEKSDNCVSSTSSHSFKISMARERRKLRKRRSLSKSLLCKKLSKKKVLFENSQCTEKSVVYVDEPPEKDDSVNNFVFEINGAKSELNQETTIFVELTVAKLVPKDTPVLHSLTGIDKENTIPPGGVCGNAFDLNSELFSEICSQKLEEIPLRLSDNVMVLDLEVEDAGGDIFSSPYSQSYHETTKKSNSQGLLSSTTAGPGEKTEQWDRNGRKRGQSFDSECFQKDDNLSVQPLHSLHLMTVKFNNEYEQPKAISASKTYVSEDNKKSGSINHGSQERLNLNKTVLGKTCRDIAASWKSNRNIINNSKTPATKTDEHKKPDLNTPKINDSHFRLHSERGSAFKSVPKKSTENEIAYLINEPISFKVKNEQSPSSLPLSAVNSHSFRSPIDSSQPLPPTFPQSSSESSSFSSHHHPQSLGIKSEYIHEQENCSQSLPFLQNSSSSTFVDSATSRRNSYDMKSNIPSMQSTPNCSQSSNVFRFDTDNPALRDMNLMEMVSSIQTQPLSTVTQSENPFHVTVSSSNALPDIKREIECEPQSFSRNIKTELNYSSRADSTRGFRSPVNPPRAFGLENSLSSNPMNMIHGLNIINPTLDHFNAMSGAGAMGVTNQHFYRPPFQQPDLSTQFQPSFPHQGPNLMSNAFPILQVPNQFGLPNPFGPSMTNQTPLLPPLPFAHQTTTIFHSSVMPLPPLPPPPPMPPVMPPNAGIFYLPF